MKKVCAFLLLIISSYLLPIPDYVELNNLAIIEEVGVSYQEGHYTIYLKEEIPIKDEQGINYQYEYYQKTANTLQKAYQELQKDSKKKIYLKKATLLITNVKNSESIKKELHFQPKNILHSNDSMKKHFKKSNPS